MIDLERVKIIDEYFRAANFLSAGQIYLQDNPLLKKPLHISHVKKRLLGHWGTSPGLNFIYTHLNRLIQDTNADMIYIAGPGHGGPAIRANVFLEGTMTKVYPDITMDEDGIKKLMKYFSWPGGVPSHVSPPTPGSIHEGGELGYALVHAYGAVLDNPSLIAACVIGDGEAETGPLAASWHSNKFINVRKDGAVLPILHLNGYKIAGPTIFGRMSDEKIEQFFKGCGYKPKIIEGSDPMAMHTKMWEILDWAYLEIKKLQEGDDNNPVDWPVIILKTPKGWTGPKFVDGKKIEGTFRSHQVPLSDIQNNKEHLKMLESWLLSYKPEELFDEGGHPKNRLLKLVPNDGLKMGESPHANGGILMKELNMPNIRSYEIFVNKPGSIKKEATREFGKLVRDIIRDNKNNFRVFCPDETSSNRLNHVFEVTSRTYLGEILESDEDLSHDGRVMEVLSEHLCQGWLEGYLLTGRYGIFPCYEAFAIIVDSMLNQHGKWMKACIDELDWRKPIASLNYLLTSHVWRQDHNGFSHQGPGFIQSIIQKKSNVARIYLPPDANCLLSVGSRCLNSKNYINLIIAGKREMPQWLTMEEATEHCSRGASIWHWASDEGEPDVVMASAGDVPTLESLAAVSILKKKFPSLQIRFINIVDLFILLPHSQHPHGFDDASFEKLFTVDKPVIFAFHGHPKDIHELAYSRKNPHRFHVRGYIEEGSTTTPFDMVVLNKLSRFHLAIEAVRRSPKMKSLSSDFINECQETLKKHTEYIHEYGEDLPEVVNWKWGE